MSTRPSHQLMDRASEILVIRFGSLGDLCLLAWTLARLKDRPGGENRQVTLVTKAAFAPLMEHVRGIDMVVPLTGSGLGELKRLAGTLRSTKWDQVLDAHNILRGHLLLGMMGRSPDRRLAKDTAARLAFLGFGRLDDRLTRTMHDRFEDLTAGLARAPKDPAVTVPPLASLATAVPDPVAPAILGLAPGAQWDTKRWPQEYFSELVVRHLADHSGPVRIFLGPREESWFGGGPLEKTARENDRVTVFRDRPLTEVATLLSECRRLVTNDSGLLHVAEAVGTPVVALFGPTVREFGYFPVLPASTVLERPLDCRPCSRNGKRPCHRGDLACLRDIPPGEASAVLTGPLEGK